MYIDREKLENFLYYLQDKIEYCYQEETEIAIERFLNGNFEIFENV